MSRQETDNRWSALPADVVDELSREAFVEAAERVIAAERVAAAEATVAEIKETGTSSQHAALIGSYFELAGKIRWSREDEQQYLSREAQLHQIFGPEAGNVFQAWHGEVSNRPWSPLDDPRWLPAFSPFVLERFTRVQQWRAQDLLKAITSKEILEMLILVRNVGGDVIGCLHMPDPELTQIKNPEGQPVSHAINCRLSSKVDLFKAKKRVKRMSYSPEDERLCEGVVAVCKNTDFIGAALAYGYLYKDKAQVIAPDLLTSIDAIQRSVFSQ